LIITRDWIHAHRTAGGAWNRKQIEALGLKWPVSKGWIKGVVGTELALSYVLDFERYAKAKRQPETKIDRIFDLEQRVSELENIVEQLMPTVN